MAFPLRQMVYGACKLTKLELIAPWRLCHTSTCFNNFTFNEKA